MDPQVRWTAILELLTDTDRLSVDALAERLSVSTATVRRDLDELASQRLLVRVRGGARSSGVAYDLPLRYKSTKNAEAKGRIATAAASLVAAGSVVGLTGGTTTTEVARALAGDAEGWFSRTGAGGVTVVTNAVNIAAELTVHPHVKVVLTGGVARPQSYELVGPLARPVLQQLSLDVAILGVNAVSAAEGARTQNEEEASVNALMARRAHRVIVVADADKLAARAFAEVCPADRIWTLITDQRAHASDVDALEQVGVRVLSV